MAYNRLFETGRIGNITIKNRGVMSPMGTDFAEYDGSAGDRLISYYEERAKGGIGLIITEYCGVDDVDSIPAVRNLRASRDYHISGLERLTEAVHKYGCKIFAQLHHGGATSKPALTGRQSISSSDVPANPSAPRPRPMTIEDIKTVQNKFIAAAVRCKKAGFDGIELHGAHSYLIAQFFSPYFNKRTDQYGGSFENRMRFISEIIDGIRAELGNKFPISVRICGDEMTPGMLTLEDGIEIGLFLERKGIDVINISNGSSLNGNANCDPFSYKPGWKKHVAKAFKENLSIPVIATNTIKNPDFAEELLAEGVCDFVGLGRSQFADPEFMNKAKQGRPDEIRQCIGCMYCRERLLGSDMPVMCTVNPRLGCEYIYHGYKKDGNGRPIAVIGGGPAGMEAAIVLAKRGFKVTLFDRNGKLGGTVNTASKPPYKDILNTLIKTMETEIRKLGVTTVLGREATPDDIKKINPCAVFLATGAEPAIPDIPMAPGMTCTAEDVLNEKIELNGNILIAGTGMTGLETAETLLERGKHVTLVGKLPKAGEGTYAVILNDIMDRINKYSPQIISGHRIIEIKEGCAIVRNTKTDEVKKVNCDKVVLAVGINPPKEVINDFKAHFSNIVVIGDAKTGGRIHDAIKDAFIRAFAWENEIFD